MSLEKLNKKLIERLESIYTKNDLEIIKSGFSSAKRNTTLRVNTIKTNNSEQEKYLDALGVKYQKIDCLENGYKLLDLNGNRVATLRGFESGEFYLQGITSQIPVEIMDIKKDSIILDVSAAPGGKTSHISAKLQNKGKVIANELNTIRREKLKATIKKQGCKNVEIIGLDARLLGDKYQKETFDAILFDAPCSAEGRINFNEEKIYPTWSIENIEKNAKLQKEILKVIIPLLKKGGELVYSTCTLAPEENEEIIDFLLKNYTDLEIQKININYPYIKEGVVEFMGKTYENNVKNSIRIIPNIESEGFFVAKFKKK